MSSFKKILQFIEGNLKMLGDEFNLLPDYQKEQVLYRLDICKNDCVKSGVCKYCTCSVPGKLYVSESCNHGARFPNMMDEREWEEYKEENNIKIEKN
jgi:hypothetical protein